ncbi:MAG: glycosyltransferase family 39 protein [Planctomycetes bacterium]|nr:glycosyltransferase family 39 protein [Planctomycetota bacterium]
MTSASPRFPMLKRHARWPIPVLLALSFPVFFYNLGNYGLVNGDEGFYHRTAHNMVRSGDWLTLQWVGQLRVYETFMNSPIQTWARAVMISIGGYNYWTMRLLSATCGMLAVLFTYKLARQFMTSAESFLAGVLLMVSFQFVFLHGARTGELDAIITLLFVWLAYSFVRALRENRSFIPHHLGLIALLMIKLPVIIMPVMIEAIYFATTPKYWAHVKRWGLTLLCMGPFGVIWHVYQVYDLGLQNVLNVLTLMADQASGESWQGGRRGRSTGIWMNTISNARYYGRILLFGGFPYILFVPLALVGVWRHRASRRTTDYLKIIVLTGLVNVLFFCIVARRFPWYVIPSYPFAAILAARFLFRLDRLGRGVVATILLGLAGALALTVTFQPAVENPFARRAMLIAPRPHLGEVAGMEWWIFLPVLTAVLALVVVAVRRYGRRLPVHVLPVICIVLLIGVGGARIGNGLRFTNHFSKTERFALQLKRKREQHRPIEYPLKPPAHTAINLMKYHFGEDFKLSNSVQNPVLERPLRRSEMPYLDRAELKKQLSLTPSGAKTKQKSSPKNSKKRSKKRTKEGSKKSSKRRASIDASGSDAPPGRLVQRSG